MKKIIVVALAATLAACSPRSAPLVNQSPGASSQLQATPLAASVSPTNASVTIPNPSGQWSSVGFDSSGASVSVDPNTAFRQGNIVRFWQKRVLPAPDQFGSSIYLNYQSTDCAKATFQFHKDVYLTSSGVIVNQGTGDSPVQLIVPGTIGESVFRAVCTAIQ